MPKAAVKPDEPSTPAADELTRALAADPALTAAWASLTPIGRRDFLAWIESAKQEQTQLKRVAVAIDKLARGERRPCCYSRIPLDVYSALKAAPAAQAQWKTLLPDAKRDCVDWIEATPDKAARRERIAAACARLAAGESCP
jgi:uncharacterized protein YdeI (YjbR/CyaY-like superfamily)